MASTVQEDGLAPSALDNQEDEEIVVVEDEDSEEEESDEESEEGSGNGQMKPLAISMVDDDDNLSHDEYNDNNSSESFHDEYSDDAERGSRSGRSSRGSRSSRRSRQSLSAKTAVGVVNELVDDQQRCCKYYWLCAPQQRRCLLRVFCLIVVPLTVLPVALIWASQQGMLDDMSSFLSIFEGSGSSSSALSTSSHQHTSDIVLNKKQLKQVKNYHGNNALMVNLHIGFHGGGKTFCYAIGKLVNEHGFSCHSELDTTGHLANNPNPDEELMSSPQGHYPWTHDETAPNIQDLVDHQGVHMISWGLHKPPLTEDDSLVMLKDTDWENPHLVSVLLVQDPMTRIVTEALMQSPRDPMTGEPVLKPGNSDEWWAYASGHASYKDNLALRIYSDGRGGHSNGTEEENQKYLAEAQELIKRFTFVLDAACIDEGMTKLAQVLNIQLPTHHDKDRGDDDDDDGYGGDDDYHVRHLSHHTKKKRHHSHRVHDMHEQIGDDEVYNYLAKNNKWDSELYQWSKSLALVQCKKIVPH